LRESDSSTAGSKCEGRQARIGSSSGSGNHREFSRGDARGVRVVGWEWGGGSCCGRGGLTTTAATAGGRRRRRLRVGGCRGGARGRLGVGRRLVRRSRGVDDHRGDRGRAAAAANARRRGSGGSTWWVPGGAAAGVNRACQINETIYFVRTKATCLAYSGCGLFARKPKNE